MTKPPMVLLGFLSEWNNRMEDLALLDLLECPICLEPLDVTAKVLPCQHTFCKPCLQLQESSRSALRCPECRSPVAGTVEELPTNPLLVRLLEGLQDIPLGPAKDKGHVDRVTKDCAPCKGHQDTQSNQHTQELESDRLYSRTIVSREQRDKPGGLDMKSGDVIDEGRKENDNQRRSAHIKAGGGLRPANAVQQTDQSLPQPQQQLPLCTALYDFDVRELDPQHCKDCLTFFKGDVITVIRRVDDSWIEGKLGDRVGIVPLQFTEV
ncbi:E3 ubiquitin-protein ligase SH3RF2-like isoform X1 [Clupea harengus]|uniref:E3 ubiquitin-protein ligase SH3RF2-like isoform X1 n=2 Tax=Clupea harengus TaxID=7950 RepID=A0A6P8ENX2_CLUHA|nr:E3 ubiquitin-protein ligase SH3RF2-like isoform X1 [Clupea harengus]